MQMRRHGTIASAIQEARASLKDPSRPFTPAGVSRNRTLFLDADAARNRPESRAGTPGSARSQGFDEPQDYDDDDRGSEGAATSTRDVSVIAAKLRTLGALDGAEVLRVLDDELAPYIADAGLTALQREVLFDALTNCVDHADVSARVAIGRDALSLVDCALNGADALKVARSLFDVSRSPEHDNLFLKHRVVGAALRVVAQCAQKLDAGAGGKTAVNIDALVYVCGFLKNMSNDETHLKALGRAGLAVVLCDALRAGVAAVRRRDVARRLKRKPVAQLLVQVTGALRNMCADRAQARQLETAKCATALASALKPFAGYWELALNAARALAKLSLHEPMRAQLNADPKRILDMFDALQRAHRATDDVAKTDDGDAMNTEASTYPAVVVRLGFVLGNLTAGNDRNRRLVAGDDLEGALHLVKLLRASGDAWLRLAPRGSYDAAADARWKGLEQIVIKLIRLAANVCINPAVGVAVAHAPGIDVLSRLLSAAAELDREELLLNVVSAITNLSYYVAHRLPSRRAGGESEGSTLFENQEATCEHLLSVLVHANDEAVSEAARAFGNFSRDADVRLLMRAAGVDEALVLLLAHPSRDVVFCACGALVNIAADARTKAILWRADLRGAAELIGVVRRAGLRDMELAAVTCKALHNLLLDVDVGGARIKLGDKDHDKLKQTLDELVDAAESLTGEDTAGLADDFLAAARALLSIVDEDVVHK